MKPTIHIPNPPGGWPLKKIRPGIWIVDRPYIGQIRFYSRENLEKAKAHKAALEAKNGQGGEEVDSLGVVGTVQDVPPLDTERREAME